MNQNAVKNTTSVKVSNSPILLENLVNPDSQFCKLKRRINWSHLDNELSYLFRGDHTPPSRLILGLLYLQSIDNLPYSEVINRWENSPEWQYFCGEEYLNDSFPLHPASLSIWSRVIGTQGRASMTRALGTVIRREETLH